MVCMLSDAVTSSGLQQWELDALSLNAETASWVVSPCSPCDTELHRRRRTGAGEEPAGLEVAGFSQEALDRLSILPSPRDRARSSSADDRNLLKRRHRPRTSRAPAPAVPKAGESGKSAQPALVWSSSPPSNKALGCTVGAGAGFLGFAEHGGFSQGMLDLLSMESVHVAASGSSNWQQLSATEGEEEDDRLLHTRRRRASLGAESVEVPKWQGEEDTEGARKAKLGAAACKTSKRPSHGGA
mmetsp:Transcript_33662/g.78269  ORF Transcript_33662/g.78269 Transcript_33662/m.78269 type:complete len:242 (-) Transcript_33662:92-817(-)|eukprot:CAMPEP_0171104946 /NCGR_PEP_ID=MMETSP0766_2-20121228/61644_1 /TAXON_ID=439317 /ORGANISM="Gambierdiscus australes, Strain CAWD 149" /LENGTH=241 /DNA_ID=CAMNT_0011565663 /DNA_START=55 /DNA_END=780 /DNA_ORIENTATION=-